MKDCWPSDCITSYLRVTNCIVSITKKQTLAHIRRLYPTIKARKANWIGHILRWKCFLKLVIEGKIDGGLEVTGRWGIRHKLLLDSLKETRGYRKLKAEALYHAVWRTRFGRSYGTIVRQTTEWWMDKWLWFFTRSRWAFGIYPFRSSVLKCGSSETLVFCCSLSGCRPSYRICPSWCPWVRTPLQDGSMDADFVCDEAAVNGDTINGTPVVSSCTSLASAWRHTLLMVIKFATS
jgi:hypothetical protein